MIFSSKKSINLSRTDSYIYIELEQLSCNSSVWTLGSRFEKSLMGFEYKRSDRLMAVGSLRNGSTLQLMNNVFAGSNSVVVDFVPINGNELEEWMGQIRLIEDNWSIGVGIPHSVFWEIANLLEKDALGPVEMSLEIKELQIAQHGQFFIKPENEASPEWAYISISNFNWQNKKRFLKHPSVR